MTLFVWMTETPDGLPSQVGAFMPDSRMHVSLGTLNEKIAREQFKPLAIRHRRATGQRVWLRRYETFVDEEPLP